MRSICIFYLTILSFIVNCDLYEATRYATMLNVRGTCTDASQRHLDNGVCRFYERWLWLFNQGELSFFWYMYACMLLFLDAVTYNRLIASNLRNNGETCRWWPSIPKDHYSAPENSQRQDWTKISKIAEKAHLSWYYYGVYFIASKTKINVRVCYIHTVEWAVALVPFLYSSSDSRSRLAISCPFELYLWGRSWPSDGIEHPVYYELYIQRLW